MKSIRLLTKLIVLTLLSLSLSLHAQHDPGIALPYDSVEVPEAPDYSNLDHWSALPTKKDNADLLPKNKLGLEDRQANAEVDVFYIHPTTYTKAEWPGWNGDVYDAALNERTDNLPIKYQASAFNGVGKIYAPRYRQAHLRAFFHAEEGGWQAIRTAYTDVKTAFQYYLDNYNNGRPFILAAHSQGTFHGAMLVREMIEGKPLADQMIAAYLVGVPMQDTTFQQFSLCTSPDETGCYVSWLTYARDYQPENYDTYLKDCNIVNPLTWTCEQGVVSHQKNDGFVGRKFKLREATWDAEITNGMLWVGKPHMPLGKLLSMKNFHIADYNIFWLDVRKNAALRAESYLKKMAQTSAE